MHGEYSVHLTGRPAWCCRCNFEPIMESYEGRKWSYQVFLVIRNSITAKRRSGRRIKVKRHIHPWTRWISMRMQAERSTAGVVLSTRDTASLLKSQRSYLWMKSTIETYLLSWKRRSWGNHSRWTYIWRLRNHCRVRWHVRDCNPGPEYQWSR